MMNMKNWGRRALTVMLAGTLAATVAAPTAFAATADAYKPTEYRVTVYAGNQGKVSLGDADQAAESVQLDPAAGLNGVADFSDIEYTVENEKYYAKGIRVAGLDNVRSDKNTDTVDAEGNPVNTAGVDTMLYAVPTPDGGLGNTSVPITEDTDFVVAYGILASRGLYRELCGRRRQSVDGLPDFLRRHWRSSGNHACVHRELPAPGFGGVAYPI